MQEQNSPLYRMCTEIHATIFFIYYEYILFNVCYCLLYSENIFSIQLQMDTLPFSMYTFVKCIGDICYLYSYKCIRCLLFSLPYYFDIILLLFLSLCKTNHLWVTRRPFRVKNIAICLLLMVWELCMCMALVLLLSLSIEKRVCGHWYGIETYIFQVGMTPMLIYLDKECLKNGSSCVNVHVRQL